MSAPISTERVFSLSSFEGLRLFRRYRAANPNLSTNDLLTIMENVEADVRSLDMEASVYLSDLVENDCPLDGHGFYQSCIKGVLLKHQPIWAKLMRQGCARFLRELEQEDQDVFAAAGLTAKPTPIEVVMWWDSISGYARLLADQEKIMQSRAAEIHTLEYERDRLDKLGIDLEPEWPGFDDNFAGYDVLSYDQVMTGITNLLIEVKSTTLSPMRFVLTRHEWNKAVQAAEAYVFHVWDMDKDPPNLHVRTVAQVAPHVPTDSGKGAWKNAEIPVLSH